MNSDDNTKYGGTSYRHISDILAARTAFSPIYSDNRFIPEKIAYRRNRIGKIFSVIQKYYENIASFDINGARINQYKDYY